MEGDDVAFSAKHGCIMIENLSCIQMRVSRFRRNLNSILKNIDNDKHPLNRVLVQGKRSSFWVIPHDKNKQRAFFWKNEPHIAPQAIPIQAEHV